MKLEFGNKAGYYTVPQGHTQRQSVNTPFYEKFTEKSNVQKYKFIKYKYESVSGQVCNGVRRMKMFPSA